MGKLGGCSFVPEPPPLPPLTPAEALVRAFAAHAEDSDGDDDADVLRGLVDAALVRAVAAERARIAEWLDEAAKAPLTRGDRATVAVLREVKERILRED
jgi:hypothetical protein